MIAILMQADDTKKESMQRKGCWETLLRIAETSIAISERGYVYEIGKIFA
jgi:hypothetical protein